MKAGPSIWGWPLLALVTCSSPSPPPPTLVKIAFSAAKSANPASVGAGQPVRVRVYRLVSAQGFDHADYFALDADAKGLLGKDLLGTEDVIIAPGASIAYERNCEPDTHAVGLVAAFSNLQGANWRGSASVKANATTSLAASLDDYEMHVKPASGK